MAAGGSQKRKQNAQGQVGPSGRAPAWKQKSLRTVLITKRKRKREGGEEGEEEERYSEAQDCPSSRPVWSIE